MSARRNRSSSGGIAATTSSRVRYRSGGRSAIGVECRGRHATVAHAAYDGSVTTAQPIEDVRRSLDNLKLEQDAIALYDALAAIEKDPRRAAAFRHIARNERRHADIWATRLRDQGATVPAWKRPRARVRLIIAIARVFGTK